MVIIIGLNGAPGSGKDEFAGYLSQELNKLGRPTQAESLAAIPKERISALLGSTSEVMFAREQKDQEWDNSGETSRAILIEWSEDQKARYGKTLWLEALWEKVDKTADFLIVRDVGYTFELDYLADVVEECCLFRITRPGHTFDSDNRYHLDNPFATISNHESVAALQARAVTIAEDLHSTHAR